MCPLKPFNSDFMLIKPPSEYDVFPRHSLCEIGINRIDIQDKFSNKEIGDDS